MGAVLKRLGQEAVERGECNTSNMLCITETGIDSDDERILADRINFFKSLIEIFSVNRFF